MLPNLTKEEKEKAMSSLIFLTEKEMVPLRPGHVQMVALSVNKHEATTSTVTTEVLLTTAVIDAKQNRDVITLDIPNTFVQTPMPESDQSVIMRFNGLLVEYLDELFPGTYSKYITNQNNTKILYVEMSKALYGMMLSSLLFYKHFRKDLESIGLMLIHMMFV